MCLSFSKYFCIVFCFLIFTSKICTNNIAINTSFNTTVCFKFITSEVNSQIWLLFNISEGFKEAAEKFKVESGIQPGMDLDTLDDRIKIRDAIQNGRVKEAISYVNDMHPELLDNDRYLFFHLQVFNHGPPRSWPRTCIKYDPLCLSDWS